jgi:hypothetical protein
MGHTEEGDLMRDPEEMDVQRRLHLSMRSKIILLVTPFILCTLFLSMTAGPFLMDIIVGAEIEGEGPENLPEENSSESINPDVYMTILEDNFETINPHWYVWEFTNGTGRLTDNETLLLTVSNESKGLDESIAALYDYTSYTPGGVAQNSVNIMPWLHRGIKIRLRCNNDNGLESSIGGGQRFWGFVDFIPSRHPQKENALFFRSKSPDCDRGAGFMVESIVDGKLVFRKNLSGIDMREWHNYTIIWREGNATFMVDGEIVASISEPDLVPDEYMSAYILMCDILSPSPYTLKNLTVDQWIEIDYIHLFYVEEEVYHNESEFLSELFTNASSVIEGVEEGGLNTSYLRTLYSMAENNWTHFRLPQTKKPLEDIISQYDNFQFGLQMIEEELFEQAEQAIEIAVNEKSGWVVTVMNRSLINAQKYWNQQDYEAAWNTLKLLFKQAELG